MRSLKSPRRMIATLFFIGWFFLTIGRSFQSGKITKSVQSLPVSGDLLYAISFGVFLLITIISFMTVGNSLTLMFKSPDVDVLFPTPVPPKKLLALRVIRDTITSTLVPVLIYFVMFARVGGEMIQSFQRGEGAGKDVNLVVPASVLAWVLLSSFFASMGYCSALYFSRGTEQSDRAGRLARAVVGGFVLLALGFAGLQMQTHGVSVLTSLAKHPLIATIFFPATLAAKVGSAPVTGDYTTAAFAMAALIGLTVLCYKLAARSVDWLYDISTTSTSKFSAQLEAAKSQDMVSQAANRARQGKVKVRDTVLSRWSPRGPMALVWKEAIIFGRTQKATWILMLLMSAGMTGFLSQVMLSKGDGSREVLVMATAGLMIFSGSLMFGQTGFMQMLKLGDIQKPLPFSTGQVVFFEMLGKSIPPLVLPLAMGVAAAVMNSTMIDAGLAIWLLGSGLTLLLMSLNALVMLLFPEHDDPTQRSLRGIVTMLATAICCAPPIAIFGAARVYGQIPYSVAALIPTGVALGIAVLVTSATGRLYATFNPSE